MDIKKLYQYYHCFYDTLYEALALDIMYISRKLAPFYYIGDRLSAYTTPYSFRFMNADNYHHCTDEDLLSFISKTEQSYNTYLLYFLEGEQSYQEKRNNISYFMTMNYKNRDDCSVKAYSFEKFQEYLKDFDSNKSIPKHFIEAKLEELQIHLMSYVFEQYYEAFKNYNANNKTFYYCTQGIKGYLPEEPELRNKILMLNMQFKAFEPIIKEFLKNNSTYLLQSDEVQHEKESLFKKFVGAEFYDKIVIFMEKEKMEQSLFEKKLSSIKVKL